jgi:Raf kinase inhibitor-like YbhB/YbcL family protein
MRQLLFLIIICAGITVFTDEPSFKVKSSEFAHSEDIPAKYTCKGININPPLQLEDVPEGTRSLVIIMDDPDATNGTFDHWIIWNIPVQNVIEEGSVPGNTGLNSKGENKYTGPCPPSGKHRYFFKVYALDSKLELPSSTKKVQLEMAMQDHILGKAELMGFFQK